MCIVDHAQNCENCSDYLSCKVSADVSDHVEVLRRVYGDVAEKLEAQSVARNMFQLNALTLKELESIQSKHSEPVKAAQRLLNIVMNQSGNGYAFFMDALKLTDQNHVYETIIVDGYKGKSCYSESNSSVTICNRTKLCQGLKTVKNIQSKYELQASRQRTKIRILFAFIQA